MRLHELTVTAFGPFAGTERVDFDDLNDAGLFLLTGPTGAGKTSILDAVCFALYGSVPGVRGVKTLKSQHADVDTAPEVVLDFSVRERRFVVRRSPEWVRPKKKGSGLVAEKASATLVETTDGTDHFLSSRAQEVGHLVGEVMGMNASQFVQVAMLPQGEFQRFLRAGSDERHGVLQHLFKTDRFTRIEDWVNEHSRGLREEAVQGRSAVLRILDTMADRSGVALPEELAGDGLPSAAAEGRVLGWAEQAVADAADRQVAGTALHDRTASALAEARRAHDGARLLAATLSRRDHAVESLRLLAEGDAADAGARAALETDTRAAPCLPVLRLLDEARRQRSATEAAREGELARARALAPDDLLPEDLSGATSAELDTAVQGLRRKLTRVEALLPRDRERRDAETAITDAEAALADARERRRHEDERRRAIPEELAALATRLAAATDTAARSEAIALSLDAARARLDAATRLPALEHELVSLQDLARTARDRLADAREHVQDLADRRLAGITAELAGLLEDGQACQVCGSLEHPHPALPGADAVTEAEQEQAAADYDARTEEFARATRAVAEAERRLDGLRRSAEGLDEATARTQVAGLETAREEAERAAGDRAELEVRVAALTSEHETVARRVADLATTIATLDQALLGHRATIARVAEEVLAVTGDPDTPLGGGIEALSATIERLGALAAAVTAAESAAERVAELAGEATRTAMQHGFDDAETARSAALLPAERARLEALLAERAAAAAAAQAVLADPDVAQADGRERPDLAELAAALEAAELAHADAARGHHQGEELVTSLRQNLDRLRRALDDWGPVRERSDRAESMSKLVRGMGQDNQLQMRLSAYVLATRLDQVVAAANERLAHLRDQRYLLQRTGRAARRGSQAGLGLEVVDQWTGDVREPATLSGGETFVVSLSLALGLADVVTQEAGGTEIDTLFVDEGFGTLDADTLDDVMDRLDGLRAGGRTVGVVSHVSEMRNRIPTQVHVEKHRTGSTVAVRTLTG